MLLEKQRLLMIFSLTVFLSGSLFAATGTSVGVRPFTNAVIYHSDLDFTGLSIVMPTTDGKCPAGYLAISSNQVITNYSHQYVKDVRTNINKIPVGWNYTSNSTKNRPAYGFLCQRLETDLKWVRGAKP